MIKIYAIVNPLTVSPVYVGASKQANLSILYRHSWAFNGQRRELYSKGIGLGLIVLDAANTVEEAAHLEEYWFWQFKSWGFELDNFFKRSFKRYCPKNIYLNEAA